MRVFVPAETRVGERRVAILPQVVSKFTQLGFDVHVQSGAGVHAFASDAAYRDAGATVIEAAHVGGAFADADAIASVRPLDYQHASRMKAEAVSISFLSPAADVETVRGLRDAGATGLSFDLLPRISRAQSMDALTSQALVTGYRAAVVAADHLPRFFPLFMTAAGTVQAAKVLVLGAGVAGLQAIATAKRLGARVSAYDVRPASADEVRSMGAVFVTLDLEQLEGAGGYAREMTDDRAAHQRELLAPYVAASDVVITTASIPGREAPLLVTRSMVEAMSAGSVVVDLASESGGNVEGSVAGEGVRFGEVLVWGARDVASQMPVHASQLYSMNVFALLGLTVADGSVFVDPQDDVIDGCAVVLNGEVRNEAARTALLGGE
ncbi:MAG: NAD(P)(+) transhydrogenase (Re/Si-specific) subunit alpha [Actinobacteria bacterium]|uniref:proton-translocating NAD(P)(+) transhydrogenase n=1 Tax=freshwater metagenome TaxID=449393 RepID=A0A6J7L8J4_9ZZZZ|nr:NAD(P)(+) transhydrogenase (Re/Si-specific) subunit alpha [Actinomycetota bacterium]